MKSLFVLFPVILLTACASSRNDLPLDPHEQIAYGQQQVLEAEKSLRRAQARRAEGRLLISAGVASVSEGELRVEQARRDYGVRSAAAGASTDPKQIRSEAKALQQIAERWEQGLEDIDDGEDDIARGRKLVGKATREADEATSRIDAGHNIARNARARVMEQAQTEQTEATAPAPQS